MKADGHGRALLAIIALGLFMNALNPWLRPTPVAAQQPPADLPMMEVHLRNIDSTLDEVENEIERLAATATLLAGGALGQLQCVWTLIDDGNTADIGRDGQVNLPPVWETISRAGWTLKAVHGNEFVFERCR